MGLNGVGVNKPSGCLGKESEGGKEQLSGDLALLTCVNQCHLKELK